jgi:hypothetical protein
MEQATVQVNFADIGFGWHMLVLEEHFDYGCGLMDSTGFNDWSALGCWRLVTNDIDLRKRITTFLACWCS